MITIRLDADAGIEETILEKAVCAALELAPDTSGDLTVVLSRDRELQRLNRDFLGKDEPTDVLAFPSGEVDLETGSMYLGDVIISVETATKQAEQAGHDLQSEIQLLVVHGTLHLMGFDHSSKLAKDHMWKAQSEVLTRLGIDANLVDRPNGG